MSATENDARIIDPFAFGQMSDSPAERLGAIVDTLDDVDESIRRILFVRLDSPDVADVLADARRRSAAHCSGAGAWNPYPGQMGVDNFALYTALVVRVNVLRHWARTLGARQRQRATAAIARRRAQMARKRSRQKKDVAVVVGRAPDVDPISLDPGADQLDVTVFYVLQWLDAHLLLTLAIDEMGQAPVDGRRWTAELLAAYRPSARTVFHEGELPDLTEHVRQCSFFGETQSKDALTIMFSKAIPHRCVVRDVITNIASSCIDDAAVLYMIRALMAAALLGVYRHARVHAPFDERRRIYWSFFYDPPECVEAALAARGRRQPRLKAYERDFAMPDSIDREDVVAAHYEHQLRRAGHAVPDASPDAVRRSRTYAFVAAVAVVRKGKSSTKSFVHQDTVVNVLREYLVMALERLLPHIHNELALTTQWDQWQQTVVDCLDSMRAEAPSRSIFKVVAPKLLPSKTLYTVEKQSFAEALDQECTSFLDAGRPKSSEKHDGSETPLDAPLPPEIDMTLRELVRRYSTHSGAPPLLPTLKTPPNDATDEEVARDFYRRGRVPLALFHATPSVIITYRAVYRNYQESASPAEPRAFVRYLVNNTSMYQLQLVHAFARAQIDARRIRTFALPTHLAEAQASVVRARLGLRANQAIPLGALESFVCMQCREFRGVLIDSNDDAPNELPMHGSEDVAFASTSIDQQVALALRTDGFPSWQRLLDEGRRYGTLFEYYRRNAFIDCDTRIYPENPSRHDAKPGALEACRRWLAAGDRSEFEYSGVDDDAAPMPPAASRPNVPASVPLVAPPLNTPAVYEAFLHRWQQLNGARFVIGHRPAPEDVGRAPVVVWTCASKRYKTEERKTRQTGSAHRRIADSITDQERATAERSANTRRRHDMRVYYARTLCSRRRVAAVSLLGFALVLDDEIVLACCMCTGFTRRRDAHWHDGLLICTRCSRRTRKGDSFDPAAMGVCAAVKCRQCRAPRRASERYASLSVYDEVNERFVLVHLCPRHAKKKTWLSASPNFHSLATVDAGIHNSWLSLRRWQSERDYLREEEEESMDKYVRELGVVDDDGGSSDDGADESSDKQPKQRRRLAADSSKRRRSALVK